MSDQERVPILLTREQAEQELIKQVRLASVRVPKHIRNNQHLMGIWNALIKLEGVERREDAIAEQMREVER